jgi:hypothetical protein
LGFSCIVERCTRAVGENNVDILRFHTSTAQRLSHCASRPVASGVRRGDVITVAGQGTARLVAENLVRPSLTVPGDSRSEPVIMVQAI